MKKSVRRRKRFTDAEVDLYCQGMEEILAKINVKSKSKKKKKKLKDILPYVEEEKDIEH